MSFDKVARRRRIRFRIRKVVKGSSEKPRLAIFRSNTGIYAQLIDDTKGVTLLSASTQDPGHRGEKITKTEQAALVGKKVAEKALASGITEVVFDRGGFLYHGRVKALADGAREGGLKF